MKVMSLQTPAKPAKKSQALVFEEEEVEEVPELERLRTSFVGDIEVTEGITTLLTILCTSPDCSKKTKSRCLLERNDDLCCSLFNTPRYELRVYCCVRSDRRLV